MFVESEYKIKIGINYNSECETEVPTEEEYDWDKATVKFEVPKLYVKTRGKQYYLIQNRQSRRKEFYTYRNICKWLKSTNKHIGFGQEQV